MKIIQKIIPNSVRGAGMAAFRRQIARYWSKSTAHLPQTRLSKKHVEHATVLLDRQELLEQLPKHGVVAELGVDQGDFSAKILKTCTPKMLHLVDNWGTSRYNQDKRYGVEARFTDEIESTKVVVNLGLSTEVVREFPDNYFDWIYIDTDHSYPTTMRELELYRDKVKRHGLITGHDFIVGNWNRMVRYGVMEAVYAFCVKYNWEFIYFTSELHDNPSFAIRRIGA